MSKEKNIKTYEIFKQDRFLGILVHLLTGLGIVAGFFAFIAVMNNNQKAAFLWLGFAFLKCIFKNVFFKFKKCI